MSLQLVYSVKDISKIHPATCVGTNADSDENRNEEKLDWLKTLQLSLSSLAYCRPNMEAPTTRSPPSSPSGYETASAHSENEEIGSNDADEVLDETGSVPNICSPILDRIRAPYGPRKSRILENLLGANMLGLNVDNYLAPGTLSKTVNELKRELYQLQLYINTDIVEFCKTFFHLEVPLLGKGNRLNYFRCHFAFSLNCFLNKIKAK